MVSFQINNVPTIYAYWIYVPVKTRLKCFQSQVFSLNKNSWIVIWLLRYRKYAFFLNWVFNTSNIPLFCWELLGNAQRYTLELLMKKKPCYNLVSSALNKKRRIEHFVFLKENLNYCLDSNHFRDYLNFPLLVLYMEV